MLNAALFPSGLGRVEAEKEVVSTTSWSVVEVVKTWLQGSLADAQQESLTTWLCGHSVSVVKVVVAKSSTQMFVKAIELPARRIL